MVLNASERRNAACAGARWPAKETSVADATPPKSRTAPSTWRNSGASHESGRQTRARSCARLPDHEDEDRRRRARSSEVERQRERIADARVQLRARRVSLGGEPLGVDPRLLVTFPAACRRALRDGPDDERREDPTVAVMSYSSRSRTSQMPKPSVRSIADRWIAAAATASAGAAARSRSAAHAAARRCRAPQATTDSAEKQERSRDVEEEEPLVLAHAR